MLATEEKTQEEQKVDLDAELPCEGIRYRDGTSMNAPRWTTSCTNPGEWTRLGHCTWDSVYCTQCKEIITGWARHGYLRCRDCNATVFAEDLHWRRL